MSQMILSIFSLVSLASASAMTEEDDSERATINGMGDMLVANGSLTRRDVLKTQLKPLLSILGDLVSEYRQSALYVSDEHILDMFLDTSEGSALAENLPALPTFRSFLVRGVFSPCGRHARALAAYLGRSTRLFGFRELPGIMLSDFDRYFENQTTLTISPFTEEVAEISPDISSYPGLTVVGMLDILPHDRNDVQIIPVSDTIFRNKYWPEINSAFYDIRQGCRVSVRFERKITLLPERRAAAIHNDDLTVTVLFGRDGRLTIPISDDLFSVTLFPGEGDTFYAVSANLETFLISPSHQSILTRDVPIPQSVNFRETPIDAFRSATFISLQLKMTSNLAVCKWVRTDEDNEITEAHFLLVDVSLANQRVQRFLEAADSRDLWFVDIARLGPYYESRKQMNSILGNISQRDASHNIGSFGSIYSTIVAIADSAADINEQLIEDMLHGNVALPERCVADAIQEEFAIRK